MALALVLRLVRNLLEAVSLTLLAAIIVSHVCIITSLARSGLQDRR